MRTDNGLRDVLGAVGRTRRVRRAVVLQWVARLLGIKEHVITQRFESGIHLRLTREDMQTTAPWKEHVWIHPVWAALWMGAWLMVAGWGAMHLVTDSTAGSSMLTLILRRTLDMAMIVSSTGYAVFCWMQRRRWYRDLLQEAIAEMEREPGRRVANGG